jgi:hypothetical protein
MKEPKGSFVSWKLARQIDHGLSLYGPGNFYPSKASSLLAVLAIYASIKEARNFNFLEAENASWQMK